MATPRVVAVRVMLTVVLPAWKRRSSIGSSGWVAYSPRKAQKPAKATAQARRFRSRGDGSGAADGNGTLLGILLV